MIRVRGSYIRGLDRPRVLRRVGIVLALPVGASVPHVRGEEVDPLEDPASRGRESGVVHALPCAVGDILGNVAEAAANAIHVDRWGICLSIAHRVHRDFSRHSSHSRYISFPYHHRFLPNSIQDLVVMFQRVVEVRTTIKGIPFLILRDSTSILRIPTSRVVMARIQEVICVSAEWLGPVFS